MRIDYAYTFIHILAFDIKLPVVNKLHGIHHLPVFVSIDSINGLSLFGANPLLEPMLNVCRNYPETQLIRSTSDRYLADGVSI